MVGAGFLGHALASYQGFKYRGFQIKWVFDNDPEKIGTEINGLMVHDISRLRDIVSEEKLQVAIISVPVSAAQEIADELVSAGIRSILSYAPINLKAPEGVQVRYSDPVIQLQRMTYYQS